MFYLIVSALLFSIISMSEQLITKPNRTNATKPLIIKPPRVLPNITKPVSPKNNTTPTPVPESPKDSIDDENMPCTEEMEEIALSDSDSEKDEENQKPVESTKTVTRSKKKKKQTIGNFFKNADMSTLLKGSSALGGGILGTVITLVFMLKLMKSI